MGKRKRNTIPHWVALLVCCAVFQNGGLQHINASIHSIGTNSYIFFINVIRSSDAIIGEKKPKTIKPKETTHYFPEKKNTAGSSSKQFETTCTLMQRKANGGLLL